MNNKNMRLYLNIYIIENIYEKMSKLNPYRALNCQESAKHWAVLKKYIKDLNSLDNINTEQWSIIKEYIEKHSLFDFALIELTKVSKLKEAKE